MAIPRVDRARVLVFRARASHLDRKLGRQALAQAAAGGLQDSAPRAAIISLHARVQTLEPSAWEDPSLVQIWGPRGADYIVPRADVSVFTRGRMPRDIGHRKSLDDIATDVLRVLDGQTRPTRDVYDALPQHGHLVRTAAITGHVHIRWDASKISAIPVDVPDDDPEPDRLELARRFLGWFGPATKKRFAWWSGMDESDAGETWSALEKELIDVEFDGEERQLLGADESALIEGELVRGVRLIPHGDPFIKIDAEHLVSDPEQRLEIFPVPKVKASFWPVSGAVMIDAKIVGSWARQQRRVTVNPWISLSKRLRDGIDQEALTFPIASLTKASVEWVR